MVDVVAAVCKNVVVVDWLVDVALLPSRDEEAGQRGGGFAFALYQKNCGTFAMRR